ncbi:MAG: hypothetical protein P8M34_11970 [Saprospiraceae bacterium]|nr:hypothetical protein [Saprospiraceae bacterium]
MKYSKAILILSSLSLIMLTILSCGKDYETCDEIGCPEGYQCEEDSVHGWRCVDIPFIKEVNGKLLNRVDGSPISGMRMETFTHCIDFFGLNDCSNPPPKRYSTTDDKGNFIFNNVTGNKIRFAENAHKEKYQQYNVWVDGESESLFRITGADISLNRDAPQELTLEIYPRTYFNLHFTNVTPAHDDDIIEFSIDNGNVHPIGADHPTEDYAFVGIYTDQQLSGETYWENTITIEYQVTTEDGTESFTKKVECTPGGMTEIKIEY